MSHLPSSPVPLSRESILASRIRRALLSLSQFTVIGEITPTVPRETLDAIDNTMTQVHEDLRLLKKYRTMTPSGLLLDTQG